MEIRNEDIESVTVQIPEGHSHIRTAITLKDGTSFTLQEASMSNILRAFVAVKTHPTKRSVTLRGVQPDGQKLKRGYAEWQLLEDEGQ